MQSQPLKRSLTAMKRRAASLPNLVMLDSITEDHAAIVEAQKQEAIMNESQQNGVADLDSIILSPPLSATGTSIQQPFEPPDPVPPTPEAPIAQFSSNTGLLDS